MCVSHSSSQVLYPLSKSHANNSYCSFTPCSALSLDSFHVSNQSRNSGVK